MAKSYRIFKNRWQLTAPAIALVMLAAMLFTVPAAAQTPNTKLDSLTLSVGGVAEHEVTLDPVFGPELTYAAINADATTYQAFVGNYVEDFTVTPTWTGSATVTVANTAATSGEKTPVPLNPGDKEIIIAVRSGNSTETYIVNVNRHDNAADFVTIWEVTATESTSIRIPATYNNTYDYTVDWGDGTSTGPHTNQEGAIHNYGLTEGAQRYKVAISGAFPQFYAPSPNSNAQSQFREVVQWGTQEWRTMTGAFSGVQKLKIPARDAPDLTKESVVLNQMFKDAVDFNSDINHWDVSNQKNMGAMFQGALEFNQPLDQWDVSKVGDMRAMFQDAGAFDQNLGGWNISDIASMTTMLNCCHEDDEGTGIGTANYNATLIGWSQRADQFANDNAKLRDIHLGAQGRTYTGAAQLARAKLTETYGWTILEDGLVDGTDISLESIILMHGDTKLDLDQGTFALPNTEYSATVAHDVSELTVTPATTESGATATVAGGAATVTLNDSSTADSADTIVTITVTSQDDSVTQAYTLTVTRDPKPPTNNNAPTVANKIADLKAIVNVPFRFTFPENTFSDVDAVDTLTYTVNAAAPPQGIDFNAATRTFSGTPTTVEKPTVTVTATDEGGGGDTPESVTEEFEINVTAKLDTAFITDWKTTTAGETITIPTGSGYFNYNVNWGDGASNTGETSINKADETAHSYTEPGPYSITITGEFAHFQMGSNLIAAGQLRAVRQWGGEGREWTTMLESFAGVQDFQIIATDSPNLVLAEDATTLSMNNMFLGAVNFTGQGMDNWNFSDVTDMQSMFYSAAQFNQNLGDWDISSVNNMENMFTGSGLSTNNYDLTLIGWSRQENIPEDITLDAGNIKYSGAATAARTKLIAEKGWMIRDGGLNAGIDISLRSLRQSTGTFNTAPTLGDSTGTEYAGRKHTARDFTYTDKDYALTVVSIADQLILSPLPNDPEATWTVTSPGNTVTMNLATDPDARGAATTPTVSGNAAASATVDLAAAGADTIIHIEVTSNNGNVTQRYTLTVTRATDAPCYAPNKVINDADAYRAHIPYCAAAGDAEDPWAGDGYHAEPQTRNICVQRHRLGSHATTQTDQGKPGLSDCRSSDDLRFWKTPAESDNFAKSTSSAFEVTSATVESRMKLTVDLVLNNPEFSYSYSDADYDRGVKVEYVITGFEDPDGLLEESCRTKPATCFKFTQGPTLAAAATKLDGVTESSVDGQASFEMPDYQVTSDADRNTGKVFITGTLPLDVSLNDGQIAKITGNNSAIRIQIELRRAYAGHGEYSPSYSDEYGEQDYIPNTAGPCDYVEQPWQGCPQGYHDGSDKILFSIIPVDPPTTPAGTASATSGERLAPDAQHRSCAGDTPHRQCPTLTLSSDAEANPETITVTLSLSRGAKGGRQWWQRLTLEAMCDPNFQLRDSENNIIASNEAFHMVEPAGRAITDWRGDCQYIQSNSPTMTMPQRNDATLDTTDRNAKAPGTQVMGPVTWTATLTPPEDLSGDWTLTASIDPRQDARGNRFTSLTIANQALTISAPEPETLAVDTQHRSCARENPNRRCPILTIDGASEAAAGQETEVTFSLAPGPTSGNQPWQRLTLETMCDPNYELRDGNGNVVASNESFHLVPTEERTITDWRGDCEYSRSGDSIMTPPQRDDGSLNMTDRNPKAAGTQVLGPITWTAILALPGDFSGGWTLSAGIDPRLDASGNQFTSLVVAHRGLAIGD